MPWARRRGGLGIPIKDWKSIEIIEKVNNREAVKANGVGSTVCSLGKGGTYYTASKLAGIITWVLSARVLQPQHLPFGSPGDFQLASCLRLPSCFAVSDEQDKGAVSAGDARVQAARSSHTKLIFAANYFG